MTENKPKQKKRADILFGQIAMRLGIVTQPQVEEALHLQKSGAEHKALGLILMELTYVTERDLERILRAQKSLLDSATQRARAMKEDNLFGKVAIRLNFCSEEQVRECLTMQEQLPQDRFMRLGDIMVIKGYVTTEQVKRIVNVQQGLILYCPSCNTQYNVVMFRPGSSLACYRCGSTMRIPRRETKLDEAIYFGNEE